MVTCRAGRPRGIIMQTVVLRKKNPKRKEMRTINNSAMLKFRGGM
jgi:hypothetical protein